MCGIFALLLRRPLDDRDIALGRAGRDALSHRGPDGHGEWVDREKGVYLGHRRLAIIDPSQASAQPFVRDGVALTYNGELYNFPAVRDELEQRGQRFETAGDVEVVLRAWQHWRQSAPARFDGMFAFTLWDGQAAHLAVDPFSEKPLYYAETEAGLYVSSEIGPLADLLDLRPELDGSLLAGYLALGFVRPPATIYPGVRKLRPATMLRVERGRVVHEERYWQPPRPEVRTGTVRPVDERELDGLHGALSDSLRGRLIADVPMCIFLSSGVDSGLVAAMAKRDFAADIGAVSVSFPDLGEADEVGQAAETARYLGLEHRVLTAAGRSGTDDLHELLSLFGQPSDAATVLSVRQMTAAVAPTAKAGLTGSGGDEITFGYGKHAHFYRQRRLYGLPQSVRLALGALLRPFRERSGIALRVSEQVATRDEERFLAQKNFPAIDWLREREGFAAFCADAMSETDLPLELASMRYERDEVMPGLRLPSMDIGSMRSSVELRTPFLSRAVVDAIAACDPRAFIAFGQKSVLRRLLRRYLPAELVDRPKRGFVYPPQRLLTGLADGAPGLSQLDARDTAEVWRRLPSGGGWLRLAVRIAVLAAFMERARTRDEGPEVLAAAPPA